MMLHYTLHFVTNMHCHITNIFLKAIPGLKVNIGPSTVYKHAKSLILANVVV